MSRRPTKEELAWRDELFKEGMAYCSSCDKVLPLDNFAKRNGGRYGIISVCKDCSKESRQKYYSANREKLNQISKTHRKNNKETYHISRIKREHKVEHRYKKYAERAKSYKKDFELTLDEFSKITSMPCFYCGNLTEDEIGDKFVGLDRIDSTKGYIKSNVIPCCTECNRMKSDFEIKTWLSKLYKIFYTNKSKEE